MTSETRTYVALIAGQSVAGSQAAAIVNCDTDEPMTSAQFSGLTTRTTEAKRDCSVKRDPEATNFCLTGTTVSEHICLSLYGQLFDGYDHSSASHFNGFVDGDRISLYDFSASDYFTFQLAQS